MGPRKKSARNYDSEEEMNSMDLLVQKFENHMQVIQRNNAELLNKLSINFNTTVAQLSNQFLLSVNDLKNVVSEKNVKVATVDDVRGNNGTIYEMSQLQRSSIRNSNFITAFKDLGGTNIIFRPGESSVHPVSFVRNLETAFDDAGVPYEKRASFALKTLKGSAGDWAHIKKDLFILFDVFKTMFMLR